MDLLQFELLIRGIAVGGNLLLAAAFLVRPPRSFSRFVTGMFALGVAAYAVLSFPGISLAGEAWLLLLLPLAAGNNVFLWLIARTQFEEGFKPSPFHLVVWLVLVALSLTRVWATLEGGMEAEAWLRFPRAALSAFLVGWALYAALRDFSVDMVEKRRIARVAFVAATAIYAGIILAVEAAAGMQGVPPWVSVLNASVLALATLAFGAIFLDETFSRLFAPVSSAAQARQVRQKSAGGAASPLARQVITLLEDQRLYREPGLSIGKLASRLGVPEHRLRATINAELGFRNFNTFLNGYRLAECKTALADPSQAEVPIITIALDSGFQSMATFNRVFKTETGLSPSDFRKSALGPSPGTS